MADSLTGNGKKKPWFGISTGQLDVKGGAIERKVGTGWSPGNSKFKKRSGKGHNLNKHATT